MGTQSHWTRIQSLMSLSLLSTQRDTVRPLVTRQTTPSSPIANMTREYKRLEERKKKNVEGRDLCISEKGIEF